MRGNPGGKGGEKTRFVKGQSGNPGGRPKNPSPERRLQHEARRKVYREVSNIVVEARKYSGLAIDTLVAIAQDGQTDSSRQSAAVELLNRGYGRPAQSLDLHLTAEAVTRRLSDMSDAELAALEQRMIAATPIVLEATAGVSDDVGELPDGDADAAQDGECVGDDEAAGNNT